MDQKSIDLRQLLEDDEANVHVQSKTYKNIYRDQFPAMEIGIRDVIPRVTS